MYHIGVDPGKRGGLALLDGYELVDVIPSPIAGKDLDLSAIGDWITRRIKADSCDAWIEKVGAMPGQGVVSMFNFGFNTGAIHGILAALHIPRYIVTPQAWKGYILAGTAKDKVAAIDYVRRLYPEVNIILPGCRVPHSGMADAICIAIYGLNRSKL